MRSFAIAFLFFTFGCAFGCKDDSGHDMPEWEGSFCSVDIDKGGVTCDGEFIAFTSEKFKTLWIMNKKGITCLYRQFINNVDAWTDPHKKCEFEGALESKTETTTENQSRLESGY